MSIIKKILFLIILGLFISSAYAVSDIQITPSNPKVGDIIELTGKANPNEDINCQAWFEVNPITSPPYYGYIMNSVEIPSSPNNFKVIGENVNDLSISVKMGIWITKSATANSDGVATVSQSNVPVGTYDIKIGGTIKDSSKPVKLKIIASTTIKADENGYFKYSYKTNNIPEGTTVYLSIGGINKEIIIGGDTPIPPAPPVVNDTNPTNNTDKEPPKINITPSQNNTNKNIRDGKNNTQNNNNNPELENIVYGTIIKHVGNATLIISDGTKISTVGDIQIKEVSLPNITLAYYISPNNAEFNKPLKLEISLDIPEDKELKILHYDEQLKVWKSIPYVYDKNSSKITIDITKSGYYAIKENDIPKDTNNNSIFSEIIMVVKIIINALINLIKSKLNII